ncbi:hypothetical protein TSUD_204020 [Trifolium subterraneum]|uniref:Histone H2A/H2B/H3 domain-containing protein n=1 Tax=Trifolium subterraneum TaxID=3900 RepID=A0A2Z6LLF3_TRISU|nr:hypothetical protein TSUD_204020 [Trifolium subterraneum]
MARVLPIHQFVLTRDKKPVAAAAGDVDVKNMMNKCCTMNMSKFNIRIARVLKQVDPDLTITIGAAEVMNGILSNMMLNLVHKSFKNSLRRKNKSKLSIKDIRAAVVEVFPPQMAKLACEAALKALTTSTVSRLSATMDQTMSIK